MVMAVKLVWVALVPWYTENHFKAMCAILLVSISMIAKKNMHLLMLLFTEPFLHSLSLSPQIIGTAANNGAPRDLNYWSCLTELFPPLTFVPSMNLLLKLSPSIMAVKNILTASWWKDVLFSCLHLSTTESFSDNKMYRPLKEGKFKAHGLKCEKWVFAQSTVL